jgi:hypothetical protein
MSALAPVADMLPRTGNVGLVPFPDSYFTNQALLDHLVGMGERGQRLPSNVTFLGTHQPPGRSYARRTFALPAHQGSIVKTKDVPHCAIQNVSGW